MVYPSEIKRCFDIRNKLSQYPKQDYGKAKKNAKYSKIWEIPVWCFPESKLYFSWLGSHNPHNPGHAASAWAINPHTINNGDYPV
jgi:hypothetical protein